MADHKVHDSLPSGFYYANRLQEEQYAETGVVPGASKVAFVLAQTEIGHHVALAVRLRPPHTQDEVARRDFIREELPAFHATDWYVRQYNAGWAAGRRGGETKFSTGETTHSWDDGYLDASANRAKWHLTHCVDHDDCGEG